MTAQQTARAMIEAGDVEAVSVIKRAGKAGITAADACREVQASGASRREAQRIIQRLLDREEVSLGAGLRLYHLASATVDHLAEAREELARSFAACDGLDWDEPCLTEISEGEEMCGSGTCIAAHWEEHDADTARSVYLRYAEAALATLSAAKEG